MDAISYYVSSGKDDWDKFIVHVQFAINSALYEGHFFSPRFLLYGQEPTLPAEVELGLPRHCSVAEIAEKMKISRELAVSRLMTSQERNAKYANTRRKHVTYNVGDKVLVRKFVNVKGKSKKLFFNYIGPYIIKKLENDVNYVIEAKIGKRMHRETIHVDKLKLYHERSNEILPTSDNSHESEPNHENVQSDILHHSKNDESDTTELESLSNLSYHSAKTNNESNNATPSPSTSFLISNNFLPPFQTIKKYENAHIACAPDNIPPPEQSESIPPFSKRSSYNLRPRAAVKYSK